MRRSAEDVVRGGGAVDQLAGVHLNPGSAMLLGQRDDAAELETVVDFVASRDAWASGDLAAQVA